MELEMYVAKTAKKIFQLDCKNECYIAVFRDVQEGQAFYAVVWMKKGDKEPKFKFYTLLSDAINYTRTIYDIIV